MNPITGSSRQKYARGAYENADTPVSDLTKIALIFQGIIGTRIMPKSDIALAKYPVFIPLVSNEFLMYSL